MRLTLGRCKNGEMDSSDAQPCAGGGTAANPKTVREKMFVFDDVWEFKVTGGWAPAHPKGK